MDIEKILENHKIWVETGGERGVRANLEGANFEDDYLYRANFERANFERANFERANLEGANFEGANLYRANFERANFERANFERANLGCANLYRANFERANFERANLGCANLDGAKLSGAKGILQWQAPYGGKRICYSVKHEGCVMHQLGCFWGTTDKAVEAIRTKYGEGSLYEEVLTLMAKCLESE